MTEAGPAAGESSIAQDETLAVYVHWPFCLAKCPYCDFNSHVRDDVDDLRWRRALCAEIDYVAAETPRRNVTSIFFGGGTPSLMAPETVAAVIDHVGRVWRLDAGAEITLEANPTSVEAERFTAYHAAGVNRLSLGVQALDDAALGFLGREHSARQARAALELARRTFPRYSFDLIYARPEQSAAAWRRELATALDMAGEHISLYQLTIEKGTPFYARHQNGEIKTPPEAAAAELFEITQELTVDAGYPAYEISNHAQPGKACRHNLSYWRYEDYAGIGPGAHGRLQTADAGARATRRHAKPETWLDAVQRTGHGTAETRPLSAAERAEEMLMMGLRLHDGVDVRRLTARSGLTLAQAVRPGALQRLTDGGFLACDGDTLRATENGRTLLNSVLSELLA
ncbi:MAG: radical SAM family heme chaperone HemW [Proteobacteria bacterium]|nr:radical SAM family heme chaperone HemW [Pseudomonadota bacterium]MDA1356234.1 radical SAM family heme chaperone HemW [Pseudomonadota bacterium]